MGCWASRRGHSTPTCQAAGEPRGHSSCSVPTSGDPGRRWVFFFLSRGFAWNSDAHVVQNSLAPTSGAPCKSHLPAQAGQAAAALGHVGAEPFPRAPLSAAGGLWMRQPGPVGHGQAGDTSPGSQGRGSSPSACRPLASPKLLLSSRVWEDTSGVKMPVLRAVRWPFRWEPKYKASLVGRELFLLHLCPPVFHLPAGPVPPSRTQHQPCGGTGAFSPSSRGEGRPAQRRPSSQPPPPGLCGLMGLPNRSCLQQPPTRTSNHRRAGATAALINDVRVKRLPWEISGLTYDKS